ncbi:DUF1223 domain-containing protein [Ferrovibrio terrae]|uniref:DUF1223 domain-containing protein n=2 Tax=Ferrovibrio terrae TaxID=2594003 RepID=A0A516GY01_9PROT|nr:DUF1223 domain-containing protein [Ferrovibrio terrae]
MPSLTLMIDPASYLRFVLRRAGHVMFLAMSLALTGMVSAHAQPQTAPATPVVLELFTSQGCNSCPPADELMQDWLRQPNIIPISLHVDYWDYLGWKDTLSRKGHGIRQQDYARNSGKREVYTPQVVVNGKFVAVGSDREAVEKALAKARRMPSVAIQAEKNKTTGNWQIKVPTLAGFEGEAKLVLCRYDAQHEVAIERGENSGKTLNYLNVARSWGDLGRWKGQSASYDVPDLTGTDWGRQGAMVMLQVIANDGVGQILGAVDIKGGK